MRKYSFGHLKLGVDIRQLIVISNERSVSFIFFSKFYLVLLNIFHPLLSDYFFLFLRLCIFFVKNGCFGFGLYDRRGDFRSFDIIASIFC